MTLDASRRPPEDAPPPEPGREADAPDTRRPPAGPVRAAPADDAADAQAPADASADAAAGLPDDASPRRPAAGPSAATAGDLRAAPEIVVIGVASLALALALAIDDHIGMALGAFAIGALAIALVARAAQPWSTRAAPRPSPDALALEALHAEDPGPVALTDARGRTLACNPALRLARRAVPPPGLPEAAPLLFPAGLPDHAEALFDAPSPSADGTPPAREIYRLLRVARAEGAAETRQLRFGGRACRVGLRRLSPDRLLWRIDPPSPAAAAGLAAALDAMGLPAVMRGPGGLAANAAARHVAPALAELDPAAAAPPDDLASADGGPLRGLPLPTALRARIAAEADAPGPEAGRLGWLLLPGDARPRAAGLDLLDRLPVAVARLGVDGVLISANERARRLLGPGAVAGARFERLAEGLGRPIAERIAEAARGRSTGRAEIARGRRDDRETFLQLSFSRLEEDGRPTLIAVMSDATELKTLEAQFVQSQKMQAVGQLAGGVAHDFNNLLTAIAGHTDLLLMRHDASDADHSDLMQIRQNSNRAAALVRQMLAFSRKQTLQPRTTDLVATLTELSHLLNRLLGEKVRLKLEHGENLGLVRVDERQFEQVVMNLVVNARDAMPAGGEVRVRTRNVRFDEEFRRDRAVLPPGDYVAIEVSDEGQGIPPDRIGQIFEPFYTTKKPGEGTGLGLSTAYGIVKQTGGFIFADSPPGSGAVFTVYLPRLEGEAGAAHRAPPADADARRVAETRAEGVVLLVEDEAPVRSFATRALGLRGYQVVEAENAEEALEILEDPGFHVDVIVSDVVMPGLDGPSWVKTARETRPDVAVVFVSGYAEGAFRRNLEGLRDFVFLPKPYSLADLSAAIREAQGDREAA
ncbi:ATP-binding response regulator [Albimonas pacifica]|uniref:histidine kinase n=1 Tax=Albimonas pacifica TaxID=1114924 RepID=A0A1I3KSF5_9RHOB|nr:ATP-binding protein [Albimonas pacifica]SFI75314.1 two-component system, cell cycle sensor histidine kinase and response regulator CckA [Albimonas pacifica]